MKHHTIARKVFCKSPEFHSVSASLETKMTKALSSLTESDQTSNILLEDEFKIKSEIIQN